MWCIPPKQNAEFVAHMEDVLEAVIVSGSLPLVQSSDAVVSAEGGVSMLGELLSIHYNDGGFTRWEVKERSSDSTY